MKHVSLNVLRAALVQLGKKQFDFLTQGFFRLRRDQYDNVPLHVQVQLMLLDWMTHLGREYLSDHQQVVIIQKRGEQIAEWSGYLEVHTMNRIAPPVFTLTISDARWVHSNRDQQFLDLVTMEELPQIPKPAVTHFTVDLLALYLLVRDRIDELTGGRDASSTHAANPRPKDGRVQETVRPT